MKEAATDNTMRGKGGTTSRRHMSVDDRAKGGGRETMRAIGWRLSQGNDSPIATIAMEPTSNMMGQMEDIYRGVYMVNSYEMLALQDIISELRKIMKNCLVREVYDTMITPGGIDQTKQTDIAPRCGGDVDALTLAAPLPHAVAGGHFRLTPWFGGNQKKIWHVGTLVQTYVGVVQLNGNALTDVYHLSPIYNLEISLRRLAPPRRQAMFANASTSVHSINHTVYSTHYTT